MIHHLKEIQDILHQFANLETYTLFGFAHLPSFLSSQILTRSFTYPTVTYTVKALDEGFPLFINPMVDIEHQCFHIEASVFLTLPEVPDLIAFCTIEYLLPLKFNSQAFVIQGVLHEHEIILSPCVIM